MLSGCKVEMPPVMIQREVAGRLGVTSRTLTNWLRDGYGPPATRFGTSLLYDRAAVEAFAAGVR